MQTDRKAEVALQFLLKRARNERSYFQVQQCRRLMDDIEIAGHLVPYSHPWRCLAHYSPNVLPWYPSFHLWPHPSQTGSPVTRGARTSSQSWVYHCRTHSTRTKIVATWLKVCATSSSSCIQGSPLNTIKISLQAEYQMFHRHYTGFVN